jgi:hypothetical protein
MTVALSRWRDSPVDRPEGAVIGAQYVAVPDQWVTRSIWLSLPGGRLTSWPAPAGMPVPCSRACS